MQKQNKFNWKVFLTLWLASIVGTLAVLPYELTLQASVFEKLTVTVLFGVLITVQIIQSVIMFGVATFIGLLLARRVGLSAPLLERFFAGEEIADRIKPFLLPTVLFGLVGGLVILAWINSFLCPRSKPNSYKAELAAFKLHAGKAS